MPELPEVETVINGLRKVLIGKKIKKIEVRYPKIIKMPEKEFIDRLEGKIISEISRKAKYLIFSINDFFMLVHLRMEGKFFYNPLITNNYDKHSHIIFYFDDNSELIYHDVRKFGEMHLRNNDTLFAKEPLKKLGPDANNIIDITYLKEKLNKNAPIKTLLLDQTIIAGIGNIYADEILFASNISPYRLGNSLGEREIELINKSSIAILAKAIKAGGTTIMSFSSGHVNGLFQNELNVHTKENKPCPICQKLIKKVKIAGRGTYFCENCQK